MPSCCISTCKNSTSYSCYTKASYHRFPKKRTREWLRALGMDFNTNVNYKYVCSDHFSSDDYLRSYGSRKWLCENAIPNKKLFHVNAINENKENILENIDSVQTLVNSTAEIEAIPVFAIAKDTSSTSSSSSNTSGELQQVTEEIIAENSFLSPESSSNESSSSTPSVKYKLVKTFHSYSRSPYLIIISEQKKKTEYYKKKLYCEQKTNLRRKMKIAHLKKMVVDLKKRLSYRNYKLRIMKVSKEEIP